MGGWGGGGDDKNLGEIVGWGHIRKNVYFLFFLTHKQITYPSSLNTPNSKMFPKHSGIHRFDTKFWTEKKALQLYSIWKGASLTLML